MSASVPPPKSHAEDEDDLDELDDVLDQFGAGNTGSSSSTNKAAPDAAASGSASKSTSESVEPPTGAGAASSTSEGTGPAQSQQRIEEDGLPSDFDDVLSQQFAKELAKGMDEMFGSSGGAAGAGTKSQGEAGEEPPMSEEEMMKQFEKIMSEMGLDGGGGGGGGGGGAGPSATGAGAGASRSSSNNQPPANFQDAIKSTMSRLRESNSGNNAGGAGGANPFGDFSDDDMAKLLAGLGGEGGMPEGEEGMANMLEKMMGELMSKEILHEPLKELRDKYPPYLASPPSDVSSEDMTRYREQYRCVDEVVKIFEMPEFDNGSDEKKKQLKAQVSDLMTKMQDAGAPPQEVVGDMPAELENLPGFGGGGQKGDEECTVM